MFFSNKSFTPENSVLTVKRSEARRNDIDRARHRGFREAHECCMGAADGSDSQCATQKKFGKLNFYDARRMTAHTSDHFQFDAIYIFRQLLLNEFVLTIAKTLFELEVR